MGSSNIRDILTSFSPALDYFAIYSGDARIKVPFFVFFPIYLFGFIFKKWMVLFVLSKC